ncbi:MAG: Ig-like domain-containing protein [Terracidiphilus sp.]|jgi:hypothetical protein
MFDRSLLKALMLIGVALPIASCTSSPSLTSIVVSPSTMNFGGAGLTAQLTATGYYTHPGHPAQTQNITDQVSWASSATQCVTVSSTGLITSGANTCTNILVTASEQGFNGLISGSMTVNVTQSTAGSGDIASVTVIPAAQTVATLGVPIQYEALGTTSGGLTVALANYPLQLKWASSNSTVATIGAATGLATTAGTGTSTITATFTNADGTGAIGTATLTVAPTGSPEPLTALTVAPNSQTASAVGQTAQFLAIATTGSGTSVNLTNQSATVNGKTIPAAAWTSSNPSVATINSATGLATAVGAGATIITAIGTNPDGTVVTGTATYTVTGTNTTSAEPLVSLAIVPATQTALAVNQTANFIAIGTTSLGTTVNLTNQGATINGKTIAAAVWSSSNPAAATVNSATGIATAISAGSTAIVAIATNPDGTVVTGTASYTVTVPSQTEAYVSLAIVPAAQTATAVNQVGQFIAIGTTGTGTTVDLTSAATWKSSSTAVATITGPGQATAVTTGVAAITAEVKNPSNDGTVVTGSAVYTVNIAPTTEPLLSVSLLPASQTVAAAGQTTQFLAMGTFSSSASTPGTRNLANVSGYTVAWYSSNPAVATVCTTGSPAPCTSALNGLVTGVSAGTTAITAIASGNPDGSVVTGSAVFTVAGAATSTISGLSIFPGSQTITMPEVGQPNPTVNLVAIGANGSGLQSNLTSAVTWTSSNPAVLPSANIVSGGNTAVATAVGPGSTTITASYTNVSTASNPVASVVTTTATLTVTGPAAEPLLSLAINPPSPSVQFPSQTYQLTAIGTFSAAPVTQNMTSRVVWTSSNPLVATVCTAGSAAPCTSATDGLVTAVGQGTAAITATASNTDGTLVYATVPFSVNGGSAESMTALAIIPDSISLSATGQPGTLIALGTSGSTGLQQDVTASPQIVWTSSNTAIATVSSALAPTQTCVVNSTPPPAQICVNDPPGLVKGVSAGSSTITAEFTNPATGGTASSVVTAQATVAVSTTPAAEPLLSITVLPTSTTDFNLLGTAQFLAYGTFSTAPTALDITNGFFHSGFPTASCTSAYAVADAAAAAAGTALPYAQCSFVPVTWVSTAPFDFPINSAGAAGATGGLATADASGNTDIYAVAANPDGTLVNSSVTGNGMAVFNCPYVAPTYATVTTTLPNGTTTTTYDYSDILNIGECNYLTVANSLLSTLTVFDASLTSTGLNQANWLITAPSATGTPNVIHCGGTTEQATLQGSVCEATYPNGSVITLTAPAEPGVNFGGWSDNCLSTNPTTPSAAGPNSCTVVVGGNCSYNSQSATYMCESSNVTIGAVFN